MATASAADLSQNRCLDVQMCASEAAAALRFFAWRHDSPILQCRTPAQAWSFEFRRQDSGRFGVSSSQVFGS